jgi:hypothetical protein
MVVALNFDYSTSLSSFLGLSMTAPTHHSHQSSQTIKFSNAIRLVSRDLEADSQKLHSIPALYRKYEIKQRRLYDVINVWAAIGCAAREGFEDLRWLGRDKIAAALLTAKEQFGIDNPRNSLAALFSTENCVGLAPLTTRLLMLYAALQVDVLDLRQVSSFFSRGTQRYKTTLCKLYQIGVILEAMGVTSKTENACEIQLMAPFNTALRECDEKNPMAIANLLNRGNQNASEIEVRRREYYAIPQKTLSDV